LHKKWEGDSTDSLSGTGGEKRALPEKSKEHYGVQNEGVSFGRAIHCLDKKELWGSLHSKSRGLETIGQGGG